jgi:hypothetical protein
MLRSSDTSLPSGVQATAAAAIKLKKRFALRIGVKLRIPNFVP